MIKITDEYLIDFDSLNIILYEKVNSGSKNYKRFENNYYKAISFHGNFETLSKKLVTHHILKNRNIINSFNDIVQLIYDFGEQINEKMQLISN